MIKKQIALLLGSICLSTALYAQETVRVEAESLTEKSEKVEITKGKAEETVVRRFGSGGWIKLENVDFGKGKSQVRVRAASGAKSKKALIEIRLGSKNGKLIGKVEIPIKGWSTYTNADVELSSEVSKKNDIYVISKSGGVILDWIEFGDRYIGAAGSEVIQEEKAEWVVRAAPAMEAPVINTNPLPEYGYDRLDYGMTIGVERTPNGRIWACWVGGGDNDKAFFVLNHSNDNGDTWSDPKLVVDPHNPALGDNRRSLVGNLWTDPLGRLWLFFDQSMTYFDGRAGLWYTICENPDDDEPKWSEPVRIWHGCALNKPIVLKDGTWMLPASLWDRGKIKRSVFKEAFQELDDQRMANVLISKDQGKTWNRQGGIRFPRPRFDEHHVVERIDGTLWMTARTGRGMWESVSSDQGKTWSAPKKYMEHAGSRHFIRRLKSGRLLLVRHGEVEERTKTRSKLMAFLSEDDGKTWKGGLMLDERRGISYPDGTQAADGTIYVSYDRNRDNDGEILMARFTEDDVLSRTFQSDHARSRILISKPEGLDKLPVPSEVVHNTK